MIAIYSLTPIGKKLARSISAPDSPAYRIIHFLDQQAHSTTEQIASFTGLSTGEAASVLGILRRKKIVSEVSEVSV